jgi:hypothetical protein
MIIELGLNDSRRLLAATDTASLSAGVLAAAGVCCMHYYGEGSRVWPGLHGAALTLLWFRVRPGSNGVALTCLWCAWWGMGPGMLAMKMPVERHWVAGVLVASVLIALTAACAAYWIMIRALEWKPKADFLRLACAAIMVRHSLSCASRRGPIASLRVGRVRWWRGGQRSSYPRPFPCCCSRDDLDEV